MARDDPPFVDTTLHQRRQGLLGGRPANDEPKAQRPRMEVRNLGKLNIAAIPPRQWVLGQAFCKTFLSSVIGSGAAGKTSLRLAQCLAIATGRPITGEQVHRRERVLVICLEDDFTEMERRLAALLKHYSIPLSEVDGWLHYANPRDFKIAAGPGSLLHSGHAGDLLDELYIRQESDPYGVISIDPFVKSHSVEESDNTAVDVVLTLLSRFASATNCAVDIPHHARKGIAEAGDADRSRGASSNINGQRLAYTLTPMSADEAGQFGVSEADRKQHVRVDPAKINLARTGEPRWFRLVSVALDNATADYPHGDHIQAIEPWAPTDIWAGPLASFGALFDDLNAGLPDGRRYTDANAAKDRAAWKVVQRHLDRTEAQARQIIDTWVRDGVFRLDQYHDPVNRKPMNGLVGNLAKRPG